MVTRNAYTNYCKVAQLPIKFAVKDTKSVPADLIPDPNWVSRATDSKRFLDVR